MAHSYEQAEHDSANGAKRVNVVSGTITASSQVTVTLNNTPTIYAVVNTSAAGQSSVVLDTGANWIGLATTTLGSAPTLYAVVNTSAAGQSSVVLDSGANWVGLVSVSGTVEPTNSKTLVYRSFGISASGNNTIFVPSNTFNIVHLALSANATVGVNILSGVTYLTGNASLNMTFFPGGGIVENGQILNPVYKGATSADAFVIATDTATEIAGKVVYYDL